MPKLPRMKWGRKSGSGETPAAMEPTGRQPAYAWPHSYHYCGFEFAVEQVSESVVQVTGLGQTGWLGIHNNGSRDKPYIWTKSRYDIGPEGLEFGSVLAGGGFVSLKAGFDSLCEALIRDAREKERIQKFKDSGLGSAKQELLEFVSAFPKLPDDTPPKISPRVYRSDGYEFTVEHISESVFQVTGLNQTAWLGIYNKGSEKKPYIWTKFRHNVGPEGLEFGDVLSGEGFVSLRECFNSLAEGIIRDASRTERIQNFRETGSDPARQVLQEFVDEFPLKPPGEESTRAIARLYEYKGHEFSVEPVSEFVFQITGLNQTAWLGIYNNGFKENPYTWSKFRHDVGPKGLEFGSVLAREGFASLRECFNNLCEILIRDASQTEQIQRFRESDVVPARQGLQEFVDEFPLEARHDHQ